jgi:hypothetical protein
VKLFAGGIAGTHPRPSPRNQGVVSCHQGNHRKQSFLQVTVIKPSGVRFIAIPIIIGKLLFYTGILKLNYLNLPSSEAAG